MNLIHFATLRTGDGQEIEMTVDLDLLPYAMTPPAEDASFSEIIWDITSALSGCQLMVFMGLWQSTDKPSDPIPHLFLADCTADELSALLEVAIAVEGVFPMGGYK